MNTHSLGQDLKTEFDTLVSSGVTLVDFWAPWCGPCRAQAGILQQIEPLLPGQARIHKVNIDEDPELAERFGVQAIPTLLLFHNGQPVKQWVGAQNSQTLLAAIKRAADTGGAS